MIPPNLPVGHLSRTAIQTQLESVLNRRISVLQAPAGFGKTAVLGEICGKERASGVAVGWVSLDEDDTPEILTTCLLRAVQCAGMDVSAVGDYRVWSELPFSRQLGTLARTVEAYGDPCLLALDEADRLPPPSVSLLGQFLSRLPDNSRIALAWRFNPGIDLVTPLLHGTALVIGPEQLRLSRSEIASLHGKSLSGRELAAVEERTGGWPVILAIDLSSRAPSASRSERAGRALLGDFAEIRLLRGVAPRDRAHLLDLAVFDEVSAELVDDVLGSSESRSRVNSVASLQGIFIPAEDSPEVKRLPGSWSSTSANGWRWKPRHGKASSMAGLLGR